MTPTSTSGSQLRYGAYHRVSDGNGRDLDDESTITDKVAFDRIDGWAKASGVTISERYLDWDKTGSQLDRPELNRMLDDLRAGVIDGIAVAKTDRLSRAKTGDALRLVAEIQEIRPGSLALLDLGVDPTTPTGEMLLTILLAFARLQWRQFKEGWADAQERALRRKVWIGQAPLGYLRFTDATKSKSPLNGTLHADPAWAPVVRQAFKVAAAEGMHATVDYLQQYAPQRQWTTHAVRKLLSGRVYLGESRGKPGSHEALTTPAVWQAAQLAPRSRRTNGDYPLSGIASCARCGAPLTGGLQTVRSSQYRRYRCSNPACGGGTSIRAEKLEEHVRMFLQQQLADLHFRQRFDVAGLETAQAKLDAAEGELERYLADVRVRGLVGEKAWNVGVDARQAEVEQALAALSGLDVQARRQQRLPAPGQLDDAVLRHAAELAAGVIGPLEVARGRGTMEERLPAAWCC